MTTKPASHDLCANEECRHPASEHSLKDGIQGAGMCCNMMCGCEGFEPAEPSEAGPTLEEAIGLLRDGIKLFDRHSDDGSLGQCWVADAAAFLARVEKTK